MKKCYLIGAQTELLTKHELNISNPFGIWSEFAACAQMQYVFSTQNKLKKIVASLKKHSLRYCRLWKNVQQLNEWWFESRSQSKIQFVYFVERESIFRPIQKINARKTTEISSYDILHTRIIDFFYFWTKMHVIDLNQLHL